LFRLLIIQYSQTYINKLEHRFYKPATHPEFENKMFSSPSYPVQDASKGAGDGDGGDEKYVFFIDS
jgi:hypothetical protein